MATLSHSNSVPTGQAKGGLSGVLAALPLPDYLRTSARNWLLHRHFTKSLSSEVLYTSWGWPNRWWVSSSANGFPAVLAIYEVLKIVILISLEVIMSLQVQASTQLKLCMCAVSTSSDMPPILLCIYSHMRFHTTFFRICLRLLVLN